MEKEKLTQHKQTIHENRWNSLLELDAELEGWFLLDDKEQKRMKSLRRAIKKYIIYLED